MTNWIKQYTLDEGYEIINITGNGDCFFKAVEKAFAFEGSKVSVKSLRKFISNHMTEDIFKVYKTLWIDVERERNGEMMMRLMFMQSVHTLDQLKQIVLTPRFWANETAISILEKGLKLKFILFSEPKYRKKQFPCIETAEIIDDELDPLWYILLRWTGGHYDLVTYNNISRLRKEQIPDTLMLDLIPIFKKKVVGFKFNECIK